LSGASAQHDEIRVKAALIYNITRFVEWPDSAFSSPEESLVLCVVGPKRVAETLEHTVRGRTVHGRRIRIVHGEDVLREDTPHLLYLARQHGREDAHWLEELAELQVLVVADDPTACLHGARLCFFRENNRVRIAVAEDPAPASGPAISSQLLKLARPVSQLARE
jgi:hypothetical protein